MVSLDEIAGPKNDFNLSLSRYIDSTEPEDLQDIDGHLRGGIPERDLDALAAYWQLRHDALAIRSFERHAAKALLHRDFHHAAGGRPSGSARLGRAPARA